MAGKLAELYVVIGANADKFNKAFDGVLGKSKTLGMQFEKLAKIGAVAGAALAGTMFAIAYKTAKSRDEMWKLSQKVGVGVEALSALKHAAEKSGISIEKLSMGLGILSKKMLDANFGLLESKRAFTELGVQYKDAYGKMKNMNVLLPEIADRFAKMESGSRKTALAMELFGKSGKEMIPMLNLGAEGIKKEMELAEKLGIVIDEKAGLAAQRFIDSLTDLKAAAWGATQVFGAQLIPIFTKFFEEALKIFTETKDKLDLAKWAKNTALGVIDAFGSVIKIIHGLGLAFGTLKFIVFAFGKFWIDTASLILKTAEFLGKLGAKIMKVEWISPYQEALKTLDIISKSYGDTIEDQINKLADQIEGYEKIKKALQDFRIAIEEGDKSTNKIKKSFQELLPAARELGKVLDKAAGEYEENIYKLEADNAEYLDIIKRNTETEFEYRRWGLKRWYEEKVQNLSDVLGKTEEFYEEKAKLDKAYQSELKKILKEEKLAWLENLFAVADATVNLFNQIGALANTSSQNKIALIDEEYQKKKEAIDNSIMDDQAKYAATERLDREYERKKRAIQKEAFETQKKISLAIAAINIAESITKALTGAIPPWSFILAGLAAAAGAVQLAAIAAQEFPGAQKGGITEREGLVHVHPKELISPIEKLPTVFQQIAPQLASGRRQKQETIVQAFIRIGDMEIKDFIVKTIDNELRHRNLRVPA